MTGLLERLLSPARHSRKAFEELTRIGVVVIGRESYGTPRVLTFRNDPTRLRIGSFTAIGPGVTFVLGGNHPTDRLTVFPLRERLGVAGEGQDGFPSTKGDIVVGSDVWIGANVTVVSGVTVGDGAVIAAGTVVIGDVAPYSIVAGVPGRRVGMRFGDDDVARLLRLAWWERDRATVAELAPILCDPHRSIDELEGALLHHDR